MPKSSLMPKACLQTTVCNSQVRGSSILLFSLVKASSSGTKYLPVLSRNTGTTREKEATFPGEICGQQAVIHIILLFNNWPSSNNIIASLLVTFWSGLKILENCQELVRKRKELVAGFWSELIFLFLFFFFWGGMRVWMMEKSSLFIYMIIHVFHRQWQAYNRMLLGNLLSIEMLWIQFFSSVIKLPPLLTNQFWSVPQNMPQIRCTCTIEHFLWSLTMK